MKFASFLLCSLFLAGCTIAPKYVTSATVETMGSYQDAGIVDWYYVNNKIVGAYVVPEYVQNYRYLVKTYGNKLTPPVTSPRSVGGEHEGLYVVDIETLAQYAKLTGNEINNP